MYMIEISEAAIVWCYEDKISYFHIYNSYAWIKLASV